MKRLEGVNLSCKYFINNSILYFLGEKNPTFYEIFPEIQDLAKLYVIEQTQKKSYNFSVLDLCNFIDSASYEIIEETKECEILIKSETSVRDYLRRWGITFGCAKCIYFEGHERPDVVQDREIFVDYYLSRKENYYSIASLDKKWIKPIEKPCVLMFHDESTFRCGEQLTKRWFKKGNEPFISKGRRKSVMVSDFLVSHPSGPFFNFNEAEWSECILTAEYIGKKLF